MQLKTGSSFILSITYVFSMVLRDRLVGEWELNWVLKNRFGGEKSDLGPVYQFVHFLLGHIQGL